jgi:hypothetical protein
LLRVGNSDACRGMCSCRWTATGFQASTKSILSGSRKWYGLFKTMQQLAELEAAIRADTDLRERIVRSIGSSSVALLALVDDRGSHRLELAGSGTLVVVNGVYYILTAAHVWEEVLKSALRLGITMTDNIDHKSWIDIDAVIPIVCKEDGSKWTEWGPDLALLRVPPEYVGGIEAFHVFEDVATPGKPMNAACLESWVLTGAPKELGTFSALRAELQISGTFVSPRYHRRGEHDYFDVLMDTKAPDTPKSFGGLSGGGLWRIMAYISPTTGKIDWSQRLKGVAFYEFPQKDGARVLRCHGPSSLSAVAGETVELDVATLAEAYLQEATDNKGDGGWAREELWRSVRNDLVRGLAVIALVLDYAESDNIAEPIAAGPMKDLLSVHGRVALNRVAQACEHSERMRLVVSRLKIERSDALYASWQELNSKYDAGPKGTTSS